MWSACKLKDIAVRQRLWKYLSNQFRKSWNMLSFHFFVNLIICTVFTVCLKSLHNMSAPEWVTPEVKEKLNSLKDFGFQVKKIKIKNGGSWLLFQISGSIFKITLMLFNVKWLQTLFGVHKHQEKSRLQGGKCVRHNSFYQILVNDQVHIAEVWKHKLISRTSNRIDVFVLFLWLVDCISQIMFLNWLTRATVCLSGILLGEIVKNLTKMAVPDPKHRLKMMLLSAVSELMIVIMLYFSVAFGGLLQFLCPLKCLSPGKHA